MRHTSSPGQFGKSAWTLASIAVVVAALYLAKSVLVPMTLAVLLSFLLSPVCDWLERRRLSRIPAVLATATVGFTMLGIVAWLAAGQISNLAPNVPEYQRNFEAKFNSLNLYAVSALSKVTDSTDGQTEIAFALQPSAEPPGMTEQPISVRVVSSPTSPLQIFGRMFGKLLYALGWAGLVVVLVVFFLVRRDDLRDRFIRLIGHGEVTLTTQMLEDASRRVSGYLAMQFLINFIFGTAAGVGLFVIGVPNAILWGILAATLRFVPYIGPWIAAAMPIALSMAISTSWRAPTLTIGLFIVLELITNNVLEPWLYGRNTGVSAVAVLLAAVFWTWIWGPVGLLLATPLTVCLLVIGKHIPQLSFLNILLGNEPVFEPTLRIYQRLLAGDREEATEVLDEYLAHTALAEVYNTSLIPALASTEMHWHRGELDEGRRKFIMQSLKEMVLEQGEHQRELGENAHLDIAKHAEAGRNPPDESIPPRWNILCVPAHDEGDEIAAMMLTQVIETRACHVETISVKTTISELVELIATRNADVVCISSTPPAAVARARYLCMRLRRRIPDITLVVGLWNTTEDLAKAKERIGVSPTTHVVVTLVDAQAQLRLLIESLLFRAQQPAKPDCVSEIERTDGDAAAAPAIEIRAVVGEFEGSS
jgi:predicted PurR-regulated permease PerM